MKKFLMMIAVALFLSTGVAMAEVNVNTATTAELTELPGIGAVKAQAIVDYRDANGEFANLSELTKVDGIGEATVEGLKDQATTGSTE